MARGPTLSLADRRTAPYLHEPQKIRAAALRVNELDRLAGFDRDESIGGYILDEFFGGSIEEWRSRRGNKRNSVRRIAEDPCCGLRKSALCNALSVCITVRALPWVRNCEHVNRQHVLAVRGIEPKLQQEWLERAEQSMWSAEVLRTMLQEDRQNRGDRRGRPKSPISKRALSTAHAALRKLVEALNGISQAELSPSERQEVVELMAELGALLAGLHEGLAPPASGQQHRAPSQSGFYPSVALSCDPSALEPLRLDAE